MSRERIIQFGTGRLLRGFVDCFVDSLNRRGLYDGKIVVVQSTGGHTWKDINDQHGKYHLVLRGIENGQPVEECRAVESISRALEINGQFDEFLQLAENPDMQVIVSNTTEVGIQYDAADRATDAPPSSFPAKLCRLLYRRYECGLPGFLIFPCELIDSNAQVLKGIVCRYAEEWGYGQDFLNWLEQENKFCNTLVDRICTGFPKEEEARWQEKIGEKDKLLNVAEPFHLWAIEGDYEALLPFCTAGCNVVWTTDITPYKKRKVRILNGGHTSMVLGASLLGLENVLECMRHEQVHALFRHCIWEEIVPALGGGTEEESFARAMEERFSNPYLCHHLSDIAVNSVSKFKVRILPTILEYREQFGALPDGLCFSLAALLAYYRLKEPKDKPEYIRTLKEKALREILSDQAVWGRDLSFLMEKVSPYYERMLAGRTEEAYQMILKDKGGIL